jgi:hypothetical protein
MFFQSGFPNHGHHLPEPELHLWPNRPQLGVQSRPRARHLQLCPSASQRLRPDRQEPEAVHGLTKVQETGSADSTGCDCSQRSQLLPKHHQGFVGRAL